MVSKLSIFSLASSPSQQQSPSRADEQSAPSGDTAARITEVDEARRKKLREIELKVAEYAQKLEAKGESNIAQQCNKYREKLLEVTHSLHEISVMIIHCGPKSFTISKLQ